VAVSYAYDVVCHGPRYVGIDSLSSLARSLPLGNGVATAISSTARASAQSGIRFLQRHSRAGGNDGTCPPNHSVTKWELIIMAASDIEPLIYCPDAAFVEGTGLSRGDLALLEPQLEQARKEMLETDLSLYSGSGDIPDEKQPLDAGFHELPNRILAEYQQQGDESELGRILSTADRLQQTVDRVVVLGIGGSYMGARAIMDVCCHPYHNEISRLQRDGRPRMYFEGNNVDNGASQGLLDLLTAEPGHSSDDERWGIVVISKSGGTLETAVAFRQFLAALRKSTDDASLADLVVPVTGIGSKLHRLTQQIGCRDTFEVPDGVGGRFSVLSAVGLLPAAVLGVDVVKLLEGAAAMNEHFRTAPANENIVLQHVGVSHLLERDHNVTTRIMSVWAKGLETVGLWYDQLLAESLGKEERGALPVTAVNTRDLHSRGQQHQEGVRDKLITNVIVGSGKNSLMVGESEWNQDDLNRYAQLSLPSMMSAAVAGTNKAYADVGRPTVDLTLPAMDAASLGQLLQMLMLTTVLEGRLIGINPYGQPGVEDYKNNMREILDSQV